MFWLLTIFLTTTNLDGSQHLLGHKARFVSQEACLAEFARLQPKFSGPVDGAASATSGGCTPTTASGAETAALPQEVWGSLVLYGSLSLQ